jgi:hypothetical protein
MTFPGPETEQLAIEIGWKLHGKKVVWLRAPRAEATQEPPEPGMLPRDSYHTCSVSTAHLSHILQIINGLNGCTQLITR